MIPGDASAVNGILLRFAEKQPRLDPMSWQAAADGSVQSFGAKPFRQIGLASLKSTDRGSILMGFFRAHSTQIVTPGMAFNRAGAIGCPQKVQGLAAILFAVLIGENAVDHRRIGGRDSASKRDATCRGAEITADKHLAAWIPVVDRVAGTLFREVSNEEHERS